MTGDLDPSQGDLGPILGEIFGNIGSRLASHFGVTGGLAHLKVTLELFWETSWVTLGGHPAGHFGMTKDLAHHKGILELFQEAYWVTLGAILSFTLA